MAALDAIRHLIHLFDIRFAGILPAQIIIQRGSLETDEIFILSPDGGLSGMKVIRHGRRFCNQYSLRKIIIYGFPVPFRREIVIYSEIGHLSQWNFTRLSWLVSSGVVSGARNGLCFIVTMLLLSLLLTKAARKCLAL